MDNDAIADRLKAARIDAGFRSATDAAKSLGVRYPTYAAHENGSRGLERDSASHYARRFRVSLDWLLTGRGRGPGDDPSESSVPVMGYLGAGAEVEPDFEQVPSDGIDQIHVPFQLPEDMIAFVVRGESMVPAYRDGTVLIVYREQHKPLTAFYGEEAAVRTEDGRRFVKTIRRGQGDTVSLYSWNADAIENVRLAWIGEIFAALPASALRRVERQGGIQGQLRLKSA